MSVQTCLITGGTGTFGHALVPILLDNDRIDKIIVYSRDEQKQALMAARFPDPRMRFFLGDIRDEKRLSLALRSVDVVFHAAALKMVPKGEYDPVEFVETNVNGTKHLISAALNAHTQSVVLLSTDKAVSPANLYGATKLTAERMFIAANNLAGNRSPFFNVARYGNVTGSRGSVLTLWKEQLKAGVPLTVTDNFATRFWITDEEAAYFALSVLRRQSGGAIMIPKMPTYLVGDLVEAFFEVHGVAEELRSAQVTGLRPGEKMHEELIGPHEIAYNMGKHFCINGKDVTDRLLLQSSLTSEDNSNRLSSEKLIQLVSDWVNR